jgi:uncharacterized protein (DUF885 family)
LGLAACGAGPAPPPSSAASVAVPRDRLNRIAERYWDEHAASRDPIAPQALADSLGHERRDLAELLAVPPVGLDPDSRLSYDILRRRLELDIEGFTYPAELLPVNPFEGMPQQLARFAAETGQHPLKTAKDYENWLLQIDAFTAWTRQAIANMREGARRGYTSPRSVVERTLPLLQSLGEDGADNVFYWPQRTMPRTLDASERARLAQSLGAAVKDKLLPAYRQLHDFLQGEYLARARPSMALSALPLGTSWYAFRVKRATGTQLTPNEIHAVGLAEVERLRTRLAALPAAAGGAADASAGTPRIGIQELVSGYQALKTDTLSALPALFSAVPSADFEIREFLPAGEAAAPLIYQPAAPDGGSMAVLYVSAAPAGMPPGVDAAGFFREALPGRHYQSALQRDRVDLPKFRRFGGDPAFVQGWALYAASLGEELGIIRDDAAKRGALMGELTCAAALVVDTGLHAKGWTRDQAVDYLRAQLSADAAGANLAVDRFTALPGDALACKIGELRIRALRNRAQTVMGTRFDIHEFHSQILKDGAMPLDILEAKMKRWMEARP